MASILDMHQLLKYRKDVFYRDWQFEINVSRSILNATCLKLNSIYCSPKKYSSFHVLCLNEQHNQTMLTKKEIQHTQHHPFNSIYFRFQATASFAPSRSPLSFPIVVISNLVSCFQSPIFSMIHHTSFKSTCLKQKST